MIDAEIGIRDDQRQWFREMKGDFEFDFLVLVIVREVNFQVLCQHRTLAIAFNDVAYQIIIYGDLH